MPLSLWLSDKCTCTWHFSVYLQHLSLMKGGVFLSLLYMETVTAQRNVKIYNSKMRIDNMLQRKKCTKHTPIKKWNDLGSWKLMISKSWSEHAMFSSFGAVERMTYETLVARLTQYSECKTSSGIHGNTLVRRIKMSWVWNLLSATARAGICVHCAIPMRDTKQMGKIKNVEKWKRCSIHCQCDSLKIDMHSTWVKSEQWKSRWTKQ